MITSKRPPIPVFVISVLLIGTSLGGSIQHRVWTHVAEFDGATIAIVELAALVAGVFMLMGHTWARWLAMAWIAFHVAISIPHVWPELVVHVAVLGGFAFALFRRTSREFFAVESPPAG